MSWAIRPYNPPGCLLVYFFDITLPLIPWLGRSSHTGGLTQQAKCIPACTLVISSDWKVFSQIFCQLGWALYLVQVSDPLKKVFLTVSFKKTTSFCSVMIFSFIALITNDIFRAWLCTCMCAHTFLANLKFSLYPWNANFLLLGVLPGSLL